MTGMFGRLAIQAMAIKSAAAPSRIRPASAIHSQVPMADTREPEIALTPQSLPPVTDAFADTIAVACPRERGNPMAPESARSASQAPLVPARPEAGMQLMHVMEFDRVVVRDAQMIERTRDVPAPLLAEAPEPRIVHLAATPLTASPREGGNGQSRRSGEPAEVHVHIGRIEVTTAPEPAPARKPKPTARRETLPLADYLSRKTRS
jgi:hypothetical protein